MTSASLLQNLARIDLANALLAERRREVEHRFDARPVSRAVPSDAAADWVLSVADGAPAADCAAPSDAWKVAFAALTDAADAFLAGGPEERAALASSFGGADALTDGHSAYFVRAAAELGASRDPIWLRRCLALAALAGGGSDYRAEQLALDGLVAAAKACGVDPAPEFRRVAVLASSTRPFGHGRTSVRAYLLGFAGR